MTSFGMLAVSLSHSIPVSSAGVASSHSGAKQILPSEITAYGEGLRRAELLSRVASDF